MTIRETMTYGVLPSESAFREAFDAVCPDGFFRFRNDPRVGTARFEAVELWAEIVRAQLEYERDYSNAADDAGLWCASVLGCLGLEWV